MAYDEIWHPCHGCKSRGDVSPSNDSAASPPMFSSSTPANVMTVFFWSSLHLEQKFGHLGSDDLFFFGTTFWAKILLGLHFILGKNLGICAGVSILLNHAPQSQKMVNFAESSPPMLIVRTPDPCESSIVK